MRVLCFFLTVFARKRKKQSKSKLFHSFRVQCTFLLGFYKHGFREKIALYEVTVSCSGS